MEKAEKREETVAVAVVQLLPVAGSGGSAGGSDVAGSHFLLVQRPPSGLLAGLWQFPLLQLGPEEAGSLPRQQQLMDEYLEAQLGAALCPAGSTSAAGEGPTKALAVVDRRPLGQLVHVFSHIRMTMRVERIVLQGELDTQPRPADDAAGLAALQWVPGSEMQAKGLTSGVKKVYKLFTDTHAKATSKQSITRFFKPAAAAAGSDAAADTAAAGSRRRK